MTTTGEPGSTGVPASAGAAGPTSAAAAVVVVNYGSAALLEANLPSVTGLPGIAVVVVDSLSDATERTTVTALAAAHGWTLVPLPDNPGFGSAVAAGVARAARDGAQQIVLLNPDAAIPAADLQALVTASREDADALITPLIEDGAGNVWFAGGELLLDRGITRTWGIDFEAARHPWITGACLAFSVELWERVGGFDGRYFMYWEDVDLSHRVLAAGGRLVLRRDLVAEHLVGGTQQGRGKSDLYCRYNCRNRLLFAALHLPDADLRRWLRSAPRYATEVLRRAGWWALLRRPFGPSWAALRGTVEGIRYVVAERGVRSLLPRRTTSSPEGTL